MGLRATLRRLGAPARGASRALGGNESVAGSSAQPRSKLRERRSALPCRRAREAIAPGRVALTHLPGKRSPAGALSKRWARQAAWPALKPALLFRGGAASLTQEDGAA